jgi:hypothetical protein
MTEDWRYKRIEADISALRDEVRHLWRLQFYVMVCVMVVGFLALAALVVAS